jgi:transposase
MDVGREVSPFGDIYLLFAQAGLTLVHNNGQVEGQVTRIKLIKRMMFGRAGFALLRQRVLYAL